MVWGYIAVGFAGIFLGFMFASLFGNKSQADRKRDDEEQAECMRKLYEKRRKESKDES